MNEFNLSGKTALITGGGQGIGEACARILLNNGANVLIIGRDESKLKNVSTELKKLGNCNYYVADLTSEKEIEGLFTFASSVYESIEILINNAAIGQWKPALEITSSEWDHMINTNLTTVFKMSQKFGKLMIKNGYGKIVNISSISGLIVNSEHFHAHYGTSKAGVIHLTKSLAVEWARFGVRVNCIAPGYTATDMLNNLLKTPEGQMIGKKIKELTPLGDLASVEDIAYGALYLSASASDFVTGHTLSIDGGYTLI